MSATPYDDKHPTTEELAVILELLLREVTNARASQRIQDPRTLSALRKVTDMVDEQRAGVSQLLGDMGAGELLRDGANGVVR